MVLAKVFVIYDLKYGNTRWAAEEILAGIKAVEGIKQLLDTSKKSNLAELADYDARVLGAPDHMGSPSRAMKKFVDNISEIGLKVKYIAVFDTYAGRKRSVDRAMKKLENLVEKQLHNLNLFSSGLSVRVNGITDPTVEGELPKCAEFSEESSGAL